VRVTAHIAPPRHPLAWRKQVPHCIGNDKREVATSARNNERGVTKNLA
jgi:hypothetical protein